MTENEEILARFDKEVEKLVERLNIPHDRATEGIHMAQFVRFSVDYYIQSLTKEMQEKIDNIQRQNDALIERVIQITVYEEKIKKFCKRIDEIEVTLQTSAEEYDKLLRSKGWD